MTSILLDDDGRIRDEIILGWLVLPTVESARFDRDQILATFEHLGLDASFVGQDSTAVDAFNRASRGRRHSYISPTRSDIELEVRDLPSERGPEYILRAILRHETARQRRAVTMDIVGQVVFYRGVRRGPKRRIDDSAARLQFRLARDNAAVHPDEWQTIIAFVDSIRRDYEGYRSSLTGDAIRKMARDYLRVRLHAVQVKPSVYFVPHAWADELGRLRTAIESLPNCEMELFPVLDLPDQRATISRAFERDTDQPLQNLAMRLRNVLKTNVSVAVYRRLQGEFDSLVERTKTYADTLRSPAVASSSAIDVATALLHEVREAALVSQKRSP